MQKERKKHRDRCQIAVDAFLRLDVGDYDKFVSRIHSSRHGEIRLTALQDSADVELTAEENPDG